MGSGREANVPTAWIGRLEPAIRLGVLSALRGKVDLIEADVAASRLIDRTPAGGVGAVLARRDEVARLQAVPEGVVAIGLSSSTYDVLMVSSQGAEHLWNPTPEGLLSVIRDARAGSLGRPV